jgi:hypothetical protein
MKTFRIFWSWTIFAALLSPLATAQRGATRDTSLDPHLFMTLQDFEARKALVQQEPWAGDALQAVLKEADGYPMTI